MGSMSDNVASNFVQKLIQVGIDGVGPLKPAISIAQRELELSDGDAEKAIRSLVKEHIQLAAGSGFVTGLGGFFTLPVALPANVVGFYAIATRLVASIAHLRGYSLHDPNVRSAITLTLTGDAATEVLGKAGVTPSGKAISMAIKAAPASTVAIVNKAVGFRLIGQVGKFGAKRLGRAVPIVGGLVGAAMDWYFIHHMASQAKEQFPQLPTAN